MWLKFIVDPSFHSSWRYIHHYTHDQINYMLTHFNDTIVALFNILYTNLNLDLPCQSYFYQKFTSLYLLFCGIIYLFYPHEKINLKTRIGTLLVFCILYFGTYIIFMVTWKPLGELAPHGVQSRYFFPVFSLIPIFLGFNHMKGDTTEIDYYILMLTIVHCFQNIGSYYFSLLISLSNS